jgi:predicted phosphate transport protein (TIGR00153 family)
MLGWFQKMMPKEEKFFDFFDRHAAILNEAAIAMKALLAGGDSIPANSALVTKLENDADAVTHEVLLAVRRSFITPFDRSDIRDLITSMDDAIDQMRQTVKTIDLFEIKSFEPEMQQLGDVIVEAAKFTVEAVEALRKMQQNAAKLHVLAGKLTKLEEHSDELHDIGLKKLFKAHAGGNAMAYIAGSEIYAHLEKVVDRFEDVADRVNAIVVEHV